jgi:hypothetical protein
VARGTRGEARAVEKRKRVGRMDNMMRDEMGWGCMGWMIYVCEKRT